MSSIVDKLQRRRCCPINVNGEQFHVRALTITERKHIDSIEHPMAKSWFALGCGLCKADGSPEFQRPSDKTPEQFSAEIESLCSVGDGIPTDTFRELCDAINRVGLVPKQETIQKN